MSLAPLLLALAAQEVVGLKPGETARENVTLLAGAHAHTYVHGRMLDAASSAPIAGAAVELWYEDHRGPAVMVERSESRADGSFYFECHETPPRGDKLILRAPGYRSTLVSANDADEVLLLPLARHLRLRALDLDGKPIAGAHAGTRQTCAHAPAAFAAASDAQGRFDLSTFPPFDDHPDIVVDAPGRGAILLQLPEQMLGPEGLEVRLPRRRPLAFQVVDSDARPIALAPVSCGAEPHWSWCTTDAAGRAVVESPFFGRNCLLELQREFLASGRLPSTFEPRFVHVHAGEGAAPAESGTVPVHVVDEAGQALDLPVGALREKGSTRHGLEGVRLLGADWGRTTLVAGGPFSGWKETVKVLEKPVETTLSVEREPVLTIHLPAGEYWLVHIQAGDDSITMENPELPLGQPVPFGKALTVCAIGEHETRLSVLGHIRGDATVDMTRPASVVQQAPVLGAPVAHRLLVEGAGVAGHVWVGGERIELEAASGELRLEVPARASYEGRIGAPGCVPLAIGPWTAEAEPLVLRKRGSLTVHGALDGMAAGGQEAEKLEDGGYRAADLAPGPLIAEIRRSGGGVVSVSLVLGDGEHRELTLR